MSEQVDRIRTVLREIVYHKPTPWIGVYRGRSNLEAHCFFCFGAERIADVPGEFEHTVECPIARAWELLAEGGAS